jgi:predicted transcriptional regulator of viral defense system
MTKNPDYQKLYDIAENQAGYFTASQAEKTGYSWERLSDLSKVGRFQRIERGIYRISLFPSSRFEDLFIAVLKSGENSVVSHESALSVYDLSDVMPGKIHIIIPKNRSRRRKGIRYHTVNIRKEEVTTYEGLPITTAERTIVDYFRNGGDLNQVKLAIHQALNRGMVTKESLLKQANFFGKKTINIVEDFIKEEK